MSECGWSLLCPAKLDSHLNEALGTLNSTHSPKAQVAQHTNTKSFQSSRTHHAVDGSSKHSWYCLAGCLGTLTGILNTSILFYLLLNEFQDTIIPSLESHPATSAAFIQINTALSLLETCTSSMSAWHEDSLASLFLSLPCPAWSFVLAVTLLLRCQPLYSCVLCCLCL